MWEGEVSDIPTVYTGMSTVHSTPASVRLSLSILGIHKLPADTAADITFAALRRWDVMSSAADASAAAAAALSAAGCTVGGGCSSAPPFAPSPSLPLASFSSSPMSFLAEAADASLATFVALVVVAAAQRTLAGGARAAPRLLSFRLGRRGDKAAAHALAAALGRAPTDEGHALAALVEHLKRMFPTACRVRASTVSGLAATLVCGGGGGGGDAVEVTEAPPPNGNGDSALKSVYEHADVDQGSCLALFVAQLPPPPPPPPPPVSPVSPNADSPERPRPPIADSRDFPGGTATFSCWAAAALSGAGVVITAPLPAGLGVVGTVELRFPTASSAPQRYEAALYLACLAAGERVQAARAAETAAAALSVASGARWFNPGRGRLSSD